MLILIAINWNSDKMNVDLVKRMIRMEESANAVLRGRLQTSRGSINAYGTSVAAVLVIIVLPLYCK